MLRCQFLLLVAVATTTGAQDQDLPSPQAGEPLVINGQGTQTVRILLPPGLYTVDMTVTDNLDQSFGMALDDNFIVTIEAVEGGDASLANEIGSSWSGSTTLRVGDGSPFFPAAGKQIVKVEASGDWEIRFTLE